MFESPTNLATVGILQLKQREACVANTSGSFGWENGHFDEKRPKWLEFKFSHPFGWENNNVYFELSGD